MITAVPVTSIISSIIFIHPLSYCFSTFPISYRNSYPIHIRRSYIQWLLLSWQACLHSSVSSLNNHTFKQVASLRQFRWTLNSQNSLKSCVWLSKVPSSCSNHYSQGSTTHMNQFFDLHPDSLTHSVPINHIFTCKLILKMESQKYSIKIVALSFWSVYQINHQTPSYDSVNMNIHVWIKVMHSRLCFT